MIEIQHLKTLPVKQTNKSGVIRLTGSELYVDERENRYAYFCFRNATSKPCFAIHFLLREYNAEGLLLKEDQIYLPNLYLEGGESYIVVNPIQVEKETEGAEVYVSYGEFSNGCYCKDVYYRHLSPQMNAEFQGIPETDPQSLGLESQPIVWDVQQSITQEPAQEEPSPAASENAPLPESSSTLDVPSEQQIAVEAPTEENKTEDQTEANAIQEAVAPSLAEQPNGGRYVHKRLLRVFAYAFILAAAIVALYFIISYDNWLIGFLKKWGIMR